MPDVMRFSTDDLPLAERLPYFVAATTDFTITPVGDPAAFAATATTTRLGPLMITEFDLSPSRCCRGPERVAADGRDHFSINFPLEGHADVVMDGIDVPYAAGDALVVDLSRGMDVTTAMRTRTINVLVPRRFLEEVLPALAVHRSIAAGADVALARAHAHRLLEQPPDADPGIVALHARALRDTLAAMLTPLHRNDPLERRRSAGLLARAARYIDDNLGAGLDVGGLCTVLGVSRAVLYRAVVPVGGIEALILRRRLAGVRRRLADPSDTRTIAAIARDCGFPDSSQFSRQFRRIIGTTPGRFRDGAQGQGHGDTVPDDDWQRRYQALVATVVDA